MLIRLVDHVLVGRFPTQNACFVASLMALAQAVHIQKATMSGASLTALTFAFLFFLIGFSLFQFVRRINQNPEIVRVLEANQAKRDHIFIWLLKIAVLQQLWFFVSNIPHQDTLTISITFLVGAVIFCFDAPMGRAPNRDNLPHNVIALWHRQRPLVILGLHLFICLTYLLWAFGTAKRTPDVYYFQRDGCRALLEGINPYTLRPPSIYPPGTPFYAPELVKDGILQFGYVYMPLTLLMALPGYLMGDVRFALLIAMSLCGWCLMQLKPTQRFEIANPDASEQASRIMVLAASLLLFFPFFIYFLFNAWTDSFVAVTFCVVVLCAFRRSPWLPVAVGLWLVSKQYVVVMLPLVMLLIPPSTSSKDKKRFFSVVLGTALVVSLPMILWNVREFVWSALLLQFKQPLRDDALSFLVASKLLGFSLPFWLPFSLAIAATIWALKVAPRNVHGFCAACTLVFFVFVAWNKQAFINYYFVIFAMLCCTLATFNQEDRVVSDNLR